MQEIFTEITDYTDAQFITITKYPCAKVFNSTQQSIANITATIINFNSELFDTDAIHDTVTNNSRLTIKTAGVYIVSASIGWDLGTAGARKIDILLNGVSNIASITQQTDSNGYPSQNIVTLYKFNINDYVTLSVQQWQGSSLNCGGSFSIAKVG